MIRIATINDLPAIVEIYNGTISGRMATADLVPIDVEARRPWFEEHDYRRHPIWVEVRKAVVIGWLSLGPFYRREAWDRTAEVSVYVNAAYRRQGVATSLLSHAIGCARGLGLSNLMGLIFAHNNPSRLLFDRLGFEVWGQLPGVTELDGIGRDVVIMGLKGD